MICRRPATTSAPKAVPDLVRTGSQRQSARIRQTIDRRRDHRLGQRARAEARPRGDRLAGPDVRDSVAGDRNRPSPRADRVQASPDQARDRGRHDPCRRLVHHAGRNRTGELGSRLRRASIDGCNGPGQHDGRDLGPDVRSAGYGSLRVDVLAARQLRWDSIRRLQGWARHIPLQRQRIMKVRTGAPHCGHVRGGRTASTEA
jgi:hypothetical protein